MSNFPPVAELVPHASSMLLLSCVVAATDISLRAEAEITREHLFFHGGKGVPAYVGFELMAQTISAYDGLRRRRKGLPPAIGFLLGCRRYETARPYFFEGETLRIEVVSVLGEEGLASFQCQILDKESAVLAKGAINVYRPSNPEAFLDMESEA